MPHVEINHPLIWIFFFWISGCSGMASIHGYTEQAQNHLLFFHQNLTLFSWCCTMHFNGKVLGSWSEIGPGNCFTVFCALQFFSFLASSSSTTGDGLCCISSGADDQQCYIWLFVINVPWMMGNISTLGAKYDAFFLLFFSAWMSKRQKLKISSRNLAWLCKTLPLNLFVPGKAGIICIHLNSPLLTEGLIIAFWGMYFLGIIIQLKTFQDHN